MWTHALMVAIRDQSLKKLIGPKEVMLPNTQKYTQYHCSYKGRLCIGAKVCFPAVGSGWLASVGPYQTHFLFWAINCAWHILDPRAQNELQQVLHIPAGHVGVFLLCNHPQWQSPPDATLRPDINHQYQCYQ